MLIGILQTGHVTEFIRERAGDFPSLFMKLLAGQGFEFRTWSVVDMEFPTSVQDCDGWLLTGSRHGAYEDHAFIPPLEAFIREAYAASVPTVGICFGHQIIAQALGGRVEKFSGGWSVGRQTYEFEGKKIGLNAWHQDQVVELPPGAEVIGCSEFCQNAALLYGDRMLTVQPHPEFDQSFIGLMLEQYKSGSVPPELLTRAEAALTDDLDRGMLAARIGEFFRAPRAALQEA
ncbi:type 1 glutamine amidotransferase [Falsigemmobacter faecalis]|uniref:Type 1 glutamine amidotransferase n=1 Tax=Falsigemmobacter faecalis TaxID=2488730 RepID=A0A3P3DI88_9RHOB|nr:type 1 glutamine amidotransferase [Falsigemmobacter faecalis]RRH73426.1 type 1 glutamine amidotransferase [Falsigemmobacter faecalis]